MKKKRPVKKRIHPERMEPLNRVQEVINFQKGKLEVMKLNLDKEEDFHKLKSEMLAILPGFSSTVLFSFGSMRITLSMIDKARKQLRATGVTNQFRFGREVLNGENKFVGIAINRYNTM